MEGIKEVFGIGSTSGGASQVNPVPVTEQVTTDSKTPDATPKA